MPQMRIFLFLLFLLVSITTTAIAQSEVISDAKINALVKQAWSEYKVSNFEKSLLTSRVALNYATTLKNDQLIAKSYKVIAVNFNELSEFDKAIFFYHKSLFYANKVDNDSLKYSLYNNLGNIYCFEKKQIKIGIGYYKKSIAYGLKINDLNQVYFTNVNIAWAYFDAGNFNDGYPYLKFVNNNEKKYGEASTEIVVNMLNGMYAAYKEDREVAAKHF